MTETPFPALQYDRPAGPDPDGVVITGAKPMEICTEDGDVVWLPFEWFPTAGKAKMGALHGVFDLACVAAFTDLRVSREWLRAEQRWEDGYRLDSWCDEVWYPCEPTDEHAHRFWRIEVK